MRVALVDFDPIWEDPAANREKLPGAVPNGVDVAVFPELTFSGFTMDAVPDPDAESFLAKTARNLGTAMVAGHIAEGPFNRAPMNRAIAVDAKGTVVARQDKLHPFTYAGEHEVYGAGERIGTFELAGAPSCMQVCYDLRFPGGFRAAAMRGAVVFYVIANWPARRVDHWSALLRARAIENQAFVIGVNRVGVDPNEAYEPSSRAFGPLGEDLGDGVVEFDPREARELRREFPVLPDTRERY